MKMLVSIHNKCQIAASVVLDIMGTLFLREHPY